MTDTIDIATGAANDAADTVKDATDKSFLAKAQETIGSAVDAAIGAVKENPGTAAAIAGGVAAAAAGTAFGVSKLRDGGTPAGKKPGPKPKS